MDAMVVVLVAGAIVVTSLVIRRELLVDATDAGSAVIADWESFASHGHRWGPSDAQVTIVEFIDFQCPFCRDFVRRVSELREQYPELVAVVFRHLPLEQHPHALGAVRASECAASQGAFWEYHDALFAGQDLIGVRQWDDFAEDTGFPFDLALFNSCVSDRSAIASLSRDTLAARELGVTGTPTALVNGKLVVGGRSVGREVLRVLNGY